MSDIIQLLPDSIANQIAAGEVIQRPASAVKEMLENAIDAGATSIQLIIKDAGRTLIQVIDNGSGMSVTDARMSFERHATSKIRKVDDIFHIQTKGFRGEALASIASVAQVELKTKLHGEELGTQLIIEGSEIKKQEPIACNSGSSLAVKNLFFNVPARRNFLKSNAVENKHIIEEFQRVSLTHPDIQFSLISNDSEIFNLPAAGLRQRIVAILGNNYNQRLVPIEQETNIVTINGYVGKPEFAKKTRGEQYLFVNNRFIKSNYLNHAISNAFDDLLQQKMHPSYFLYLTVDPKTIDVNVHPTKTEIKFEDEKAIYAIIRSSVRQALGKFNVAPTLDFEQESDHAFGSGPVDPNRPIVPPTIDVDPTFNPFNQNTSSSKSIGGSSFSQKPKTNTQNWQELYAISKDNNVFENDNYQPIQNKELEIEVPQGEIEYSEQQEKLYTDSSTQQKAPYQLHNKYIINSIKSGYIMIHQSRAHQRIVYEDLVRSMAQNQSTTQQLLFPEQIELSAQDFALFSEIKDDLSVLGFEVSELSNNSIAINGIPADATESNTSHLIESLLDDCKNYANDPTKRKNELAKSLAVNLAVKSGVKLELEQMQHIIDGLFACENPNISPLGKTTIVTFTLDEIDKKFN